MESTTDGHTKWGTRIAYAYIAVLAVGLFLGFTAGAMINSGGTLAGDPIAVLSWFILFPVYIIADGILNSRFLLCPLRAFFLPISEGFVIWQVTDWDDPFVVSRIVAIIYVVGSLIVVGITRAVRKSKKAQHPL